MSAPPIKRKSSAPVNKFAGIAPSSGSRFYKGPTVPMDLAKSKKAVEAKITQGNAAIKRNATNLKARAESSSLPQHTFLNSLIITLSLLSIFSLQFCPPPSLLTTTSSPSSAFRYNPLESPLSTPKWEEVICTPTNWYRSTILEPYIVPRFTSRLNTLKTHPVVQSVSNVLKPHLESFSIAQRKYTPTITRLTNTLLTTAQTSYNQRGKPLLYLLWRQTDRITHRIKYKLKPHTDQFQALIEHHKRGIASLEPPAFVPVVRAQVAKLLNAGKWAGGLGITHTRVGGDLALKRAWRETGRAGRRFGPGLVDVVERGLDTAEGVWEWGLSQLHKLYDQHLHIHLNPHLSALDTKLYTPHLKNHLNPLYPILTSFIAAPSYPEIRKSLKDVKAQLQGPVTVPNTLKEKVVAKAKSVVDAITPATGVVAEEEDLDAYFSAGLTAAPVSESKVQRKEREREEKRERKEVRVEVEEGLEGLVKKVEEEGQKQEVIVKAELAKIIDSHTKSTASTILQTRISSIQKESARILKAYTKYLNSLDLNVSEKPVQKELRAKVVEAGDKAVAKVDGLWEAFRSDCEDGLLVKGAIDQAEVVIDKAAKKVDAAYTGDHAKLGRKLSWFNGVTSNDWSRFHGITAAAGAWRERYHSQLYDALASSRAVQSQAISEVAEVLKPFKNDIIDAEKDAIVKLGGNPSILPIRVPNIASIKDAADMAIGKSKEQIAQAIAQAQSVAGYAAPSAPVGIINVAQASASSIAEQAQSAYSAATRSASVVIGGTPTPDSVPEYVSSAAVAAASSASSIANEATKSIASIAGVAPTPDSLQASAQSALLKASSAYHQATRSASSAVGATPSPETIPESVESVIAAATSVGESVLEEVVATASSVYVEASSAVIAPIVTPASSIMAEVSSTASSLVNEASSAVAPIISDASSVVHDATRSAIKAVGATPSPEGYAEYLASRKAEASKSYSSVTRAVSKAVGATPSPETLEDHVEALLEGMAGFKESVASVAEDAASTVSSLASEGTQRVKVAVRRDEL